MIQVCFSVFLCHELYTGEKAAEYRVAEKLDVKCCTVLEFAMKQWYDKTTKKKGFIHGKYI